MLLVVCAKGNVSEVGPSFDERPLVGLFVLYLLRSPDAIYDIGSKRVPARPVVLMGRILLELKE